MEEVIEKSYEADLPVEEGLTKFKAIVQVLRMKIVDLEARAIPSTPPEEVATREEVKKDAIASLEASEALCMQQ